MGVLVRVCVQKRELARMSLPFLPLCPTGMPGTNQAESGPSSFPMDPPTPAAAAAMDEALGTNEIVALIMTNLRAGNEDGAVEQACNAVATWLGLNKQHDGVSGSDEAMWEMLMQNIFPEAPAPTMHSVYNPESALPESYKEWFYAMCKRHQVHRAAEQRYEALEGSTPGGQAKGERCRVGALAFPWRVSSRGAEYGPQAPPSVEEA